MHNIILFIYAHPSLTDAFPRRLPKLAWPPRHHSGDSTSLSSREWSMSQIIIHNYPTKCFSLHAVPKHRALKNSTSGSKEYQFQMTRIQSVTVEGALVIFIIMSILLLCSCVQVSSKRWQRRLYSRQVLVTRMRNHTGMLVTGSL